MREKLPVIDGHYHTETFIGKDGKLFLENLREYMESAGAEGLNIAALATTEWDAGNNMMALLAKRCFKNVFAHGALVYESYPVGEAREGFDPLTQYRELMAMGFDGIKMLETKPTEQLQTRKKLDDAFYEPFFAACEEDGTHFLWHVADPAEFWDPEKVTDLARKAGWYYGEGDYLPQEEYYRQVYTVLERHPRLNVTLAHFFFLSGDAERLSALFEKYPNVNVDLTPGLEMYGDFGKDPAFWRAFFIKYQDRIEFGTDAHNRKYLDGCLLKYDTVYKFLTSDEDIEQWNQHFKGLALPDEVCHKILKGNFARRVCPTPKKVDDKAFAAYVAKCRHLVRDEAILEYVDRELATQ